MIKLERERETEGDREREMWIVITDVTNQKCPFLVFI